MGGDVTVGLLHPGEMEEIAATMAAAGLPDGFHRAAAEVYRRVGDDGSLDAVLTALLSERLQQGPRRSVR